MELAGATHQQPDELLHHYTSVESFVSIIKGGELWASHIRYLNDTSEQHLIWDVLRARIQARLDTADESARRGLLLLQSLARSPLDLDVYVLCFSRDGADRLTQWRGYGGGAGVAIGFDTEELEMRCLDFTAAKFQNSPFPMGSALLNRVSYLEPSGNKRSEHMIDFIIGSPDETEPESRFTETELLNRRARFLSFSLKHNAFSDEREWRIALFDLPKGSARFRTRKSMVIPYFPFDLGPGRPEWPLIARVIVGPSPHQAETIKAVKKMLDDRVVVVGSSIPYRDW